MRTINNTIFGGLLISTLLITFVSGQSKTLVKKTEIVEDTRTVIATGVGTDRDQAVEDGLRNAVEQAIGVYLKSTTIVENYELIDKILTHSRGYVKDYDIISERVESPLYRVTLSAVVIVRELKASLLELNLYTKEIEGTSLFAAAMTKVNATQQGMKLLEDLFEIYPRNAYVVEYGEPTFVTDKTENVKVTIPYTIGFNIGFVNDFEEILDEISVYSDVFEDEYVSHGDRYKREGLIKNYSNNYENRGFEYFNKYYIMNSSLISYISMKFKGCSIKTELIDMNSEIIKTYNGDGWSNGKLPNVWWVNKKRPTPKDKRLRKAHFSLTLNEMNRIVKVVGYAIKGRR